MGSVLVDSDALDELCARVAALEGSQVTAVDYKTIYEYRDIWAEESGGATANSAEWSFGNGATGYMGLPIDAGWEIIQMGFHADTYSSTARIQVDAMDYSGSTPGDAAARTIASISLNNAQDGGGDANNAYKVVSVAPTPVPEGVIGFVTRGLAGAISDVRVYARLRRRIGTCVASLEQSRADNRQEDDNGA